MEYQKYESSCFSSNESGKAACYLGFSEREITLWMFENLLNTTNKNLDIKFSADDTFLEQPSSGMLTIDTTYQSIQSVHITYTVCQFGSCSWQGVLFIIYHLLLLDLLY